MSNIRSTVMKLDAVMTTQEAGERWHVPADSKEIYQ